VEPLDKIDFNGRGEKPAEVLHAAKVWSQPVEYFRPSTSEISRCGNESERTRHDLFNAENIVPN
jgi:hypothetical protein